MKNLKKILAMMLVLSMVIVFPTGCGSSSRESVENSTPVATAESGETTPAKTESAEKAWVPTKPITIIVSFAAGGGADVACRFLGSYLEQELGVKVVVQNVAGGGGSIGLQQLIDSAPDGYTIAYISSSKTNNNLTLEGVTATIDDYTPICKFSSDPHLVVTQKSGATDFNSLLDYVKANPENVTFGIGGAWGSHEYLRIALEKQFDLKFKRMVYSSGNLAAGGVATGDCYMSTPFFSEVSAQIEAGNVNCVAVTSKERLTALPDVPTVGEATGTDFSWYMWRGFVGPAGMDEAAVKTISDAVEKVCSNSYYIEKAQEMGVYTDFQNYKDFKEFFYADHETYKQMIESQDF